MKYVPRKKSRGQGCMCPDRKPLKVMVSASSLWAFIVLSFLSIENRCHMHLDSRNISLLEKRKKRVKVATEGSALTEKWPPLFSGHPDSLALAAENS